MDSGAFLLFLVRLLFSVNEKQPLCGPVLMGASLALALSLSPFPVFYRRFAPIVPLGLRVFFLFSFLVVCL